MDRTLRRWANQGSRVRGEKESRDRQQGTRRVPLNDVKVSKTPPLRECVELERGARARGAEGQRKGLGGMRRDWRDQGEEGQKSCSSKGKVLALSSLPGLGDAVGVRSSRTQSCNSQGGDHTSAPSPFLVHNLSLSF